MTWSAHYKWDFYDPCGKDFIWCPICYFLWSFLKILVIIGKGDNELPWRKFRIWIHSEPIRIITNHFEICVRTNPTKIFNHSKSQGVIFIWSWIKKLQTIDDYGIYTYIKCEYVSNHIHNFIRVCQLFATFLSNFRCKLSPGIYCDLDCWKSLEN